jgi:transcriptional regulator with XRE-family HTH domain
VEEKDPDGLGDGTDPVEAATADLARRLEGLRDGLWRGNASDMARDLGVSKAALSRVLNGAQAAPTALLLALAGYPGVDAGWLLTGVRPPHRPVAVPIARDLLPGPPGEHPGAITPFTVAVLPPTDAPADRLYAVLVRDGAPYAGHPRTGLRAGDCLVVAAGRPAAARVGRPGGLLVVRGGPPAAPAGWLAAVKEEDERVRAEMFEDGHRTCEYAPAGEDGGAARVNGYEVVGAVVLVTRWLDPWPLPWASGGPGR